MQNYITREDRLHALNQEILRQYDATGRMPKTVHVDGEEVPINKALDSLVHYHTFKPTRK